MTIKIYGSGHGAFNDVLVKVKAELGELDRFYIEIDGKKLKPSQCYRFDTGPANVLFDGFTQFCDRRIL